ncbi:MAG: hypothetical protein KAY37_15300 [Phycisphaerae bacterium]|nr:hypothetical protein [Phycisphaerae bacterium]MCK4343080.1 hypothetical protein [Phycisphaerae bacterium]
MLKQILGLRQFLLRGLDKVKTEWLWACTAFNQANRGCLPPLRGGD